MSRPPHGGVDRNGAPTEDDAIALVAPLTGAWIETLSPTRAKWKKAVAPLTGAWIETQRKAPATQSDSVAPLTGAWIETWNSRLAKIIERRRPPHGGVDRNKLAVDWGKLAVVAPLTGAWIETWNTLKASWSLPRSPPSRGRGSKLDAYAAC